MGSTVQRIFNVSRAGRAGRLTLTFRATEDQGRPTTFAVDDVALALS